MKFVRALDYAINGKAMRVTDEVDISLVKPRARRYEQAGAASAAGKPSAKRLVASPSAPHKDAE